MSSRRYELAGDRLLALHSSDVRRLVNVGDMEEANRLLGREYAMAGPVEAGDK